VFGVAVLLTAALRILRPAASRLPRHMALVVWLLAPAPLILDIVLSTPPEAWTLGLSPIKATLAFAGALMLCGDAIAPALEPEERPAEGYVAF
jgi:hypothetical protein